MRRTSLVSIGEERRKRPVASQRPQTADYISCLDHVGFCVTPRRHLDPATRMEAAENIKHANSTASPNGSVNVLLLRTRSDAAAAH